MINYEAFYTFDFYCLISGATVDITDFEVAAVILIS